MNINASKFLLPLGVIMLVIGTLVFFAGVFRLSAIPPDVMTSAYIFLLVFGFIFFIIGIADLYISRSRGINTGKELSKQASSRFIKVGVVTVLIVVGFLSAFYLYIYMAFH